MTTPGPDADWPTERDDTVKLRRHEQMRRESLEAANDPIDLAESRKILEEMNELRAG